MAERYTGEEDKSLWKKFGKVAVITFAAVVGIGVAVSFLS